MYDTGSRFELNTIAYTGETRKKVSLQRDAESRRIGEL